MENEVETVDSNDKAVLKLEIAVKELDSRVDELEKKDIRKEIRLDNIEKSVETILENILWIKRAMIKGAISVGATLIGAAIIGLVAFYLKNGG